jgi:hypothetical protein
MTSLSGFGSLAAIPEEKITDKITRRVTEVVDIFAPPREDFLAGGEPTWLREKN